MIDSIYNFLEPQNELYFRGTAETAVLITVPTFFEHCFHFNSCPIR